MTFDKNWLREQKKEKFLVIRIAKGFACHSCVWCWSEILCSQIQISRRHQQKVLKAFSKTSSRKLKLNGQVSKTAEEHYFFSNLSFIKMFPLLNCWFRSCLYQGGIIIQGVKLRLIQAPMQLNFSLWRPILKISLFPKRSTCTSIND